MHELTTLILAAEAYPFWRAWQAQRRTSLAHSVVWAALAWLAWLSLAGLICLQGPSPLHALLRYLALCLTGCAGVAVLGARRPTAAAWNFVVLGLLTIFLLYLAEGAATGGTLQLGWVRTVFLAGTLGIAGLNYLPTRHGFAALLFLTGCGLELLAVLDVSIPAIIQPPMGMLLIGLVPWAAWLAAAVKKPARSPLAQGWLAFRDSYGLFWALRIRDQFNRAAANGGWPIELGWSGPRPGVEKDDPAWLETWQGLMKRFS